MSETYGALVLQLRARLDELTERQWLDRQLIQWIYDGAKDVSKKTEALRATATIAAVAGTQQYTLPTDSIRIHRVEYVNTGDATRYTLEYRDFDSMDAVWWTQQTVTRDTPTFFTMWGYPPTMQMVTYPTPQVAGTFTIFYYKLPANPTLAIVPEDEACQLPEGWTDVALDYAMYMALLRDADDRWQIYKALYDEHMADLEELALRYTDMAGMIVSDAGAMVPRYIWDEGYY